jgi:hypothetical protein
MKWTTQWRRHHGDTIRKRDVQWHRLIAAAEKEASDRYALSEAVSTAIDRNAYVRRAGLSAVSAYAFLKDKCWHERGRMGWFGTSAITECELATGDKPHICKFKHHDGEAQVVSWGDAENWTEKYFDRFIAPLPDDAVLVVVDYHV